MNLHERWGQSLLWTKLDQLFSGRARPQGNGKHRHGRTRSPYYHAQLKARRKAERQHRKRVRRQAAGRAHIR